MCVFPVGGTECLVVIESTPVLPKPIRCSFDDQVGHGVYRCWLVRRAASISSSFFVWLGTICVALVSPRARVSVTKNRAVRSPAAERMVHTSRAKRLRTRLHTRRGSMECFTAHERTCFELKLLAGCADRATAGKPRFSNIAPRSPRRSPAIAMAETEPLAIFALQAKIARPTPPSSAAEEPSEHGLA